MTRRRFYAPPDCFAPDGASVTLSSEESRHLRDVLRLQAGDEAFVFDGEGAEFRCIVRDAGGRKGRKDEGAAATLEVCARVSAMRPESPLELTLAVALLKSEKFDWIVKKATELGVSRIVPVETKRADVRLQRDERDTTKRVARWQRLASEAAKQSGRARLLSIDAPCDFASLLVSASRERAWRLMFAERDGRTLSEAISETNGAEVARPKIITALVGPEGGWETEEIVAAREGGWLIITLGGRVLRAETACLTVAALLEHLYGDIN